MAPGRIAGNIIPLDNQLAPAEYCYILSRTAFKIAWFSSDGCRGMIFFLFLILITKI
jgi:hypothetical protein